MRPAIAQTAWRKDQELLLICPFCLCEGSLQERRPKLCITMAVCNTADTRLRNGRPAGGDVAETAKTKRWALREPRKRESCLRLLRSLCPSVCLKDSDLRAASSLKWMDSKFRFTGRSASSFCGTDF